MTTVPKADRDISNILDQSFPTKSDKQLSRIQAAVLASCAPLTGLWSQMARNGFTGKSDELTPTKDVLKVVRETLVLIGNASSYISTNRKIAIIDKVKFTRPRLASFLKEVCLEELGDTGGELFGPSAKKKLTERAETIKAFNEALTKIDPSPKAGMSKTSTTEGRLLERSSNTRYGSASSSHFSSHTCTQTIVSSDRTLETSSIISLLQASTSVQPTVQGQRGGLYKSN